MVYVLIKARYITSVAFVKTSSSVCIRLCEHKAATFYSLIYETKPTKYSMMSSCVFISWSKILNGYAANHSNSYRIKILYVKTV